MPAAAEAIAERVVGAIDAVHGANLLPPIRIGTAPREGLHDQSVTWGKRVTLEVDAAGPHPG
jgi:hypothetical protein